jgi:hypothetical protein
VVLFVWLFLVLLCMCGVCQVVHVKGLWNISINVVVECLAEGW